MLFFLRGRFLLQFVMVFFASVSPAYAYLDPGSGSYILQLLLGGVAGLAVITKLYWNHFLTFIGSIRAAGSQQVEHERNDGSDSKA